MENKKWTVYEHICPNGKRYIGITSLKPEKRWRNGRGYEKGHVKSLFSKAIEKYKWENIQHNILFNDLTEKEAKWLENYLICYYRTFVGFKDSKGYNMTLGGEGTVGWNPSEETRRKIGESSKGKTPFLGRHHTEESRRKIREASIGRQFSEESRRKIGESIRGRHHTEESRRKIREASIGRQFSEETRRKIGESSRGKKRTEEWKKIHSEEMKGDKNPMYGKHFSDESKKKLSQSKKGTHRVYNEDGTFHMER